MQTQNPPELDHDRVMLNTYNSKVSANGRIERRIVWNLLAHLAAKGWAVCALDDGDGEQPVSDAKAAMELMFNLDESRVYFRNEAGRRHWIFFVNGNGTDIVSDYSYHASTDFDACVEAFDTDACL